MEEIKKNGGGSLIAKLIKVQTELKAPKSRENRIGGQVRFHYRSCEDILEAVKPILAEVGAVILLDDEIVQVGDRYYVKATATIMDEDEKISVSACAREEASKQGMDAAQLTGACSSYARKYALNALLAIDDTKDADADETYPEPAQRAQRAAKPAEAENHTARAAQSHTEAPTSPSHTLTPEQARAVKVTDRNGDVWEMGQLHPNGLKAIVNSTGDTYTDEQRLAAQVTLDCFN